MRPRALAAALAAGLVLMPLAAADSLGYAAAGSTCLLVSPVLVAPQPVVQCSASQAGDVTFSAQDCAVNGCDVTASGSARGASNPPGATLYIGSAVRLPNGQFTICQASAVAAPGVACDGASEPVRIAVGAGACATFEVYSAVLVNWLGAGARFQADAVSGFELCRDAAGAPEVRATAG